MPRLARLDAPGVVHHVMIRGIERRKIFLGHKDREDFLERLARLVPETKTACYAWVLIDNHAHFLFRTGLEPLATLMRKLLTGYAVSFNRRHNRHGQLFQNRYKSIVCQEDIYLKELIRYIHLNPVRAGIVSSLKERFFQRDGSTEKSRQGASFAFGPSESWGYRSESWQDDWK